MTIEGIGTRAAGNGHVAGGSSHIHHTAKNRVAATKAVKNRVQDHQAAKNRVSDPPPASRVQPTKAAGNRVDIKA